jgi:hypothetical protein
MGGNAVSLSSRGWRRRLGRGEIHLAQRRRGRIGFRFPSLRPCAPLREQTTSTRLHETHRDLETTLLLQSPPHSFLSGRELPDIFGALCAPELVGRDSVEPTLPTQEARAKRAYQLPVCNRERCSRCSPRFAREWARRSLSPPGGSWAGARNHCRYISGFSTPMKGRFR